MAKSMTVGKRENEKKRLAKREAKLKRKEGRKSTKSSFDDMIAYVDEYGMITSTPPEENIKKQEINIEESDNDLVVFEGVNSSNIFYVQPFTLSWSHKGKDVFSGIIEHGQIWGIFQFLQHRVGGNTIGFCIGNIAIVTDDGKYMACILVHHQ